MTSEENPKSQVQYVITNLELPNRDRDNPLLFDTKGEKRKVYPNNRIFFDVMGHANHLNSKPSMHMSYARLNCWVQDWCRIVSFWCNSLDKNRLNFF